MGFREYYQNIRQHDPAMKTAAEIIFYPSFWAMGFHRVCHWLYKRKRFLLARILSQHSRWLTGIEIHPGAIIGKCLFIDHGAGVVIGETCEIGNYVTIYQGVTLGGTGKDTGKRHPTICDRVMISTGAKVLGPFTVGEGARIGAGSVVLQEVPPGSTVVGIPGRVVKRDGHRTCVLDQVQLPDPVSMEFTKLRQQLDASEQKIATLEKKLEDMTK